MATMAKFVRKFLHSSVPVEGRNDHRSTQLRAQKAVKKDVTNFRDIMKAVLTLRKAVPTLETAATAPYLFLSAAESKQHPFCHRKVSCRPESYVMIKTQEIKPIMVLGKFRKAT